MANIFDPFSDRTARDIRNTLSSVLVVQLGGDRDASVDRLAHQWLSQVESDVYRDYILDCRKRYRRVIDAIRDKQIEETRHQAVVLWNAKLFFEMHELLETIWHDAKGNERKALQGLIQAAGVYVHYRRANVTAARRLARRAKENIQTEPDCLHFIRNLDQLIDGLNDLKIAPPTLFIRPFNNDLLPCRI